MIYTIHMKTDSGASAASGSEEETRFDNVVAVPETLAKWALIAPPIWLIWHRLWFALAIYCLVVGLLFGLMTTPWFAIPLFMGGLPGLYLFLEGYQLRRYDLTRRGYETVGVADAIDEATAVEKFLANWKEPQTTSKNTTFKTTSNPLAMRSEPQPTPQGIGMFGGWEN